MHLLIFPIFCVKFRDLKLRFLAFPQGPGGFREVREAHRNHFHLSWYIIVPGVTSDGQKPRYTIKQKLSPSYRPCPPLKAAPRNKSGRLFTRTNSPGVFYVFSSGCSFVIIDVMAGPLLLLRLNKHPENK